MVVGGNLNSPLNLFISFAKALMEQGFRSDLFLAKDSVGGNRRSRRRSTAPALDGIYNRHNRRLHVVELRFGRYNPPVIPSALIGYSRRRRGQPSAANKLNVAPGSHKRLLFGGGSACS